MEALQARVDKKKMKSTQSKRLMAEKEATINELQSRVGQNQQRLASTNEEFAMLHKEKEDLQRTLLIKKNGNKMLGALMRAFRQKLEDEMAHNRQVIAD